MLAVRGNVELTTFIGDRVLRRHRLSLIAYRLSLIAYRLLGAELDSACRAAGGPCSAKPLSGVL